MAREHARGGGAVGVVREGRVADVEADLFVGVDAHSREEPEGKAADVARVFKGRRQAEGHAYESAVQCEEDLARRKVDAATHGVARAKPGAEAASAPPAAVVEVAVVAVVPERVLIPARLPAVEDKAARRQSDGHARPHRVLVLVLVHGLGVYLFRAELV